MTGYPTPDSKPSTDAARTEAPNNQNQPSKEQTSTGTDQTQGRISSNRMQPVSRSLK